MSVCSQPAGTRIAIPPIFPSTSDRFHFLGSLKPVSSERERRSASLAGWSKLARMSSNLSRDARSRCSQSFIPATSSKLGDLLLIVFRCKRLHAIADLVEFRPD